MGRYDELRRMREARFANQRASPTQTPIANATKASITNRNESQNRPTYLPLRAVDAGARLRAVAGPRVAHARSTLAHAAVDTCCWLLAMAVLG
jgi:hypothetical protein